MSADAGESVGESLRRHSVSALVETTLEGLEQSSRFVVSLAEDVGARAIVVPLSGLAQALRGLCVNALDASPPAAQIEIHAAAEDGRLVLRFCDRGTGMDDEVLAKAGDPFFTTKDTGKGMGLGLFLARTVVERLGGAMELDSTLGVGTEVRVELPLEDEARAAKGRSQGWLGSSRNGR
jgi:two-component system sensor histidine kinase RegB